MTFVLQRIFLSFAVRNLKQQLIYTQLNSYSESVSRQNGVRPKRCSKIPTYQEFAFFESVEAQGEIKGSRSVSDGLTEGCRARVSRGNLTLKLMKALMIKR